MGTRTLRRTSVSLIITKLETQANREATSLQARGPILCDLLCVVHDQRRRQIVLDMSSLPKKPDNQVKGSMRIRKAQEPFLCDLLCVDRVRNRQRIPLDVSTLLMELQDMMLEECQAIQNH